MDAIKKGVPLRTPEATPQLPRRRSSASPGSVQEALEGAMLARRSSILEEDGDEEEEGGTEANEDWL